MTVKLILVFISMLWYNIAMQGEHPLSQRKIIYPSETMRAYGAGTVDFESMISVLAKSDGKGILLAAQFLIERATSTIGQETAIGDLDKAHDLLAISQQKTLDRNSKKLTDTVARAQIFDANLPVLRSFVRGELPNVHSTEEAYLKTVNVSFLFAQQILFHPERNERVLERSDRFLSKDAVNILLQRQVLNIGASTERFPMITPTIPRYKLTGSTDDLIGIHDIDIIGRAPSEQNIHYLHGASIKILSKLCVNTSGFINALSPNRARNIPNINVYPDLQLQGSNPDTIANDIISDAFIEKYGSIDATAATHRLDTRTKLIGLALQRQKSA